MARYKKHECVLCGFRSGDVPHFRFPKDVLQRTIWANFCDVDPASMSINHKLCCRHFAVEDMIDNRYCGGTCMKRQNAVPTVKHVPDLKSESEDEQSITTETIYIKEQQNEEFDQNSVNVALVPGTADTDDEEDNKSMMSTSEASDDEEYVCNFDDMEDVRETVTRLQRIISQRKRMIKSVHQKNRRLIKKMKKVKGDIEEYARKHHLSATSPPADDEADESQSWWNKMSADELATNSEQEL